MNSKQKAALSSIVAGFSLTAFKFVVGILTASLGILSEALHSLLDLVAAVITYISVSISDKPADEDHNYGHGKVENLSAFLESILLFVTSIWIIYEAVVRLLSGSVLVEITIWSYIVVIVSMIIDFSRSRKLLKEARRHNSQALEADAIHFSTDILSSACVLCLHLLKKSIWKRRLKIKDFSDLYTILRYNDYDEDELYTKLKEHHLRKLLSRLEYILVEMTGIEEGFLPLSPKNDCVTRYIKNMTKNN